MHQRWCTRDDAPAMMHKRWCTRGDAAAVKQQRWWARGVAKSLTSLENIWRHALCSWLYFMFKYRNKKCSAIEDFIWFQKSTSVSQSTGVQDGSFSFDQLDFLFWKSGRRCARKDLTTARFVVLEVRSPNMNKSPKGYQRKRGPQLKWVLKYSKNFQ